MEMENCIIIEMQGCNYIYAKMHVGTTSPQVHVQGLKLQSNLDYSKCQGPQESFRIIGSSNDRNWKFSDIFGKAQMLS